MADVVGGCYVPTLPKKRRTEWVFITLLNLSTTYCCNVNSVCLNTAGQLYRRSLVGSADRSHRKPPTTANLPHTSSRHVDVETVVAHARNLFGSISIFFKVRHFLHAFLMFCSRCGTLRLCQNSFTLINSTQQRTTDAGV